MSKQAKSFKILQKKSEQLNKWVQGYQLNLVQRIAFSVLVIVEKL